VLDTLPRGTFFTFGSSTVRVHLENRGDGLMAFSCHHHTPLILPLQVEPRPPPQEASRCRALEEPRRSWCLTFGRSCRLVNPPAAPVKFNRETHEPGSHYAARLIRANSMTAVWRETPSRVDSNSIRPLLLVCVDAFPHPLKHSHGVIGQQPSTAYWSKGATPA